MSIRLFRNLAAVAVSAGLTALSPAADCTKTSVGKTPISDLGTGTYQGEQGGLYPAGSNARPASHDASLDRVGRVRLLGANGTPDPQNGRIVLISIGMSNTTQEFSTFKPKADSDPQKNSSLTIVDCAEGGQSADVISDPNAVYWSHVDQKLSNAGVTPAQVQSVWLKEANKNPTGPFPQDASLLLDNLRSIVRIIHDRYPNTRSVYISSRIYGGYAIGVSTLNPDPYAYESGFSVKWLIEEQLDGSAAVNFDPARGTVEAPWLAWGPYLWADGLTPRSDGLIWECSDFNNDGTHPSVSGRDEVADRLLQFFKTDSTTRRWFVDCNTNDPGTFGRPPEVHGLMLRRLAGSSIELSWESLDPVVGPAAVYDLVTGNVSELRQDGGFDRAACLIVGIADTPTTSSAPGPVPGEAGWYLVRGHNSCGRGTWGNSTLTPDPRDALDAGTPACP